MFLLSPLPLTALACLALAASVRAESDCGTIKHEQTHDYGTIRFQCIDGKFKKIGCLPEKDHFLDVGDEVIIGNYLITCIEKNANIYLQKKTVNCGRHKHGTEFNYRNFRFKCDRGKSFKLGCVPLAGHFLEANEEVVLRNTEYSCLEKTVGDQTDLVLQKKSLNCGVHTHGKVFDQRGFRYKCERGAITILGCVPIKDHFIEPGEEAVIDDVLYTCEEKEVNGKRQVTIHRQPLNCGTHKDGETFDYRGFRMKCVRGHVQKLGCLPEPDHFMEPGEEAIVNGYLVTCSGSEVNGVLEIYMQRKSITCGKYGNGEEWDYAMFRFKCNMGAVEKVGCAPNEDNLLKAGEQVDINNIRYLCFEKEVGKKTDLFLKKTSLNCGKKKNGEVWVYSVFRYQCIDGMYVKLGCVPARGEFLKAGEEITIKGVLNKCFEKETAKGTDIVLTKKSLNCGGKKNGEVWVWKWYQYKCTDGTVNQIACLPNKNKITPKLKPGEEIVINGIRSICNEKDTGNGKALILRKVNLNCGRHKNGAAYHLGKFKYMCKDGKRVIVGCVIKRGVGLNIGQSKTIGTIVYTCKRHKRRVVLGRKKDGKDTNNEDMNPNKDNEVKCRQCNPLNWRRGRRCSLTGDPHTTTFDRKKHHYQGTCRYTLVKGTTEFTGDSNFRISVKTERRGKYANRKRRLISVVKWVEIRLGKAIVRFEKGGLFTLNGVKGTAPLVYPKLEEFECGKNRNCKFSVVQYGRKGFTLSTDSFAVTFDGNHRLHVSLQDDELYKGKTEGVCGFYDGERGNDWRKPDGTVVTNYNEFGDSWIEEEWETDATCERVTTEPPEEVEEQCEDEERQKVGEEKCSMLTDPDGPFKDCLEHLAEELEELQQDCIFDVCEQGEAETTACQTMEAAAAICQDVLEAPINWRSPDFCPAECGDNSEYISCGPATPRTCTSPDGDDTGADECSEGCHCKEGYVFEDGKCIVEEKCGCVTPDGTYHGIGHQWLVEGCGEECTCTSYGEAECSEHTCSGEKQCSLNNQGLYGCSCKEGYESNDNDECEKVEGTTLAAPITTPPIIPDTVTDPTDFDTEPPPQTDPPSPPPPSVYPTVPESVTEKETVSPPPETEPPVFPTEPPSVTEGTPPGPVTEEPTPPPPGTEEPTPPPPGTEEPTPPPPGTEEPTPPPPGTEEPTPPPVTPGPTPPPRTTVEPPYLTDEPETDVSTEEPPPESTDTCEENEKSVGGRCVCEEGSVRYPDGECRKMICRCG